MLLLSGNYNFLSFGQFGVLERILRNSTKIIEGAKILSVILNEVEKNFNELFYDKTNTESLRTHDKCNRFLLSIQIVSEFILQF